MGGDMKLFIFRPGDTTKARDLVKINSEYVRFEPGNNVSGNFYFHRIGIDSDYDAGDYAHRKPAQVLAEEIDWEHEDNVEMLSQVDDWHWIGMPDPAEQNQKRRAEWDTDDVRGYAKGMAESLRLRIEALKRLPPGSRVELWAVLD